MELNFVLIFQFNLLFLPKTETLNFALGQLITSFLSTIWNHLFLKLSLSLFQLLVRQGDFMIGRFRYNFACKLVGKI